MRRYLFIGGPWDGQWHGTDGQTAYRVPVRPDLTAATFLDSDPYEPAAPLRDVLYYRQRALVPGWRFPLTLTFYTTEPLRSIPSGTVLPGSIQGMIPVASVCVTRKPAGAASWGYFLGQLHDAIRWHEAYKRWTR